MKPRKNKKDIIFLDYCKFVVRKRNLFRERKWEACVWKEEEREIRRERAIHIKTFTGRGREREIRRTIKEKLKIVRERDVEKLKTVRERERERKKRWGARHEMCVYRERKKKSCAAAALAEKKINK